MNALSNWLVQRRVARLVREYRRSPVLPLIILPSTAASLRFAEWLSRAMPVAVIGNPRLLADWAPSLCARATSPLDLWRQVKAQPQLPHAVVSYPDQLVGFDPSFQVVSVGERRYMFSIVEVMLLMKFRPPVYLGQARFRGRGEKASTSLALQRLAAEVPAGLSRQALDTWLVRLMQPAIDCNRYPHDGWLARDIFRLKVDDNFETMLKLRLLEIEALLRLGHDLPGPVPGRAYRELQAELQAVRRKPLLLAGHG